MAAVGSTDSRPVTSDQILVRIELLRHLRASAELSQSLEPLLGLPVSRYTDGFDCH